MYNFNNLTIIIVTFLTDKKTLLNCLNSIDQRVKVLVIENSSKFKEKQFFTNKFKLLSTSSMFSKATNVFKTLARKIYK